MSPTTNVGPTATTLVAPTYTEASCSPAMVMEAATRHTRCCSGRLTSIIDWTGDTTPNAVTTTIARDNPGRITSTTIVAHDPSLSSVSRTRRVVGLVVHGHRRSGSLQLLVTFEPSSASCSGQPHRQGTPPLE